MWDGMEQFVDSLYNSVLVQQWIPAMPDVQAKLERGADVADVGCGRGRALIKLAQAFPNSRCVGYDVFSPAIGKAIAYAKAEGVADRVSFRRLDALRGLSY
jgi:tRNA G46 methylase TrmB